MQSFWKPRLGAVYLGDGRCRFRVWASKRERVELHLTALEDRVVPMERRDNGYFEVTLDGVPPGARYLYRLDDEVERPDPASRHQPTTVHEPSGVVDPNFPWTDNVAFAVRLDTSLERDFIAGYATNALLIWTYQLPRIPRADPVGIAIAHDAVVVFHDGDTFTVLPELSAPPTAPGAVRTPSFPRSLRSSLQNSCRGRV